MAWQQDQEQGYVKYSLILRKSFKKDISLSVFSRVTKATLVLSNVVSPYFNVSLNFALIRFVLKTVKSSVEIKTASSVTFHPNPIKDNSFCSPKNQGSF